MTGTQAAPIHRTGEEDAARAIATAADFVNAAAGARVSIVPWAVSRSAPPR